MFVSNTCHPLTELIYARKHDSRSFSSHEFKHTDLTYITVFVLICTICRVANPRLLFINSDAIHSGDWAALRGLRATVILTESSRM